MFGKIETEQLRDLRATKFSRRSFLWTDFLLPLQT
jgi:hypothetical protein